MSCGGGGGGKGSWCCEGGGTGSWGCEGGGGGGGGGELSYKTYGKNLNISYFKLNCEK